MKMIRNIGVIRKNAKFAKNRTYEFTGTEKEDHQTN